MHGHCNYAKLLSIISLFKIDDDSMGFAQLEINIILDLFFLPMADNELSYDHLAAGLKEALQKDKAAFDADRLQKYTGIFFFNLCIR